MKPATSALLFTLTGMLLIAGCSAPPAVTPMPASATPIPSSTPRPTLVPTVTATFEPLPADWKGIPIMPEALRGGEEMGDFQFTSAALHSEIVDFYRQVLEKAGWQYRTDLAAKAPGTAMAFGKGGLYLFFRIVPQGARNQVFLHLVEQ